MLRPEALAMRIAKLTLLLVAITASLGAQESVAPTQADRGVSSPRAEERRTTPKLHEDAVKLIEVSGGRQAVGPFSRTCRKDSIDRRRPAERNHR